MHYEVVIESSKSVVICDYEEIAPVRVRLTLQEYEFIMGTDSEETVDIKKMNNTEVCFFISTLLTGGLFLPQFHLRR